MTLAHKSASMMADSSAVLFEATSAPRKRGEVVSVDTLPQCVTPLSSWKPQPAAECLEAWEAGPDPSVKMW